MASQYMQMGIPGMGVPDSVVNPTDPFDALLRTRMDQLQAGWQATQQAARQGMGRANAAVAGLPAGAKSLASRGARYAPGAMVGIQQFPTDPLAGVATLGLTALAGKGIQNLSAAIPNPIARGAVQLAGGLLAAPIAGQLGKGVSYFGNQLVGGTQAATSDVLSTVAGAQRESGQGAGTGSEPGLSSDRALQQQLQLAREMGVNIPGQYLNQNYQILQKYKEAEKSRTMQLNQQNAQLQGQLQQQLIAGQLASGAQQQAGATTREILTSNPYQASVLNTGGLRNI
tara:strand:- start:2073 stop:2927 length:855 start_codon:yes stop_codon:yes gene_type:complete